MARPTTVLLVRHGHTPTTGQVLPGRAAGLHLSEKGRVQAEGVAERIMPLRRRIAAVYASPLERTQETAAAIAGAIGRDVRTEDGLLECDFGDWTGKKLALLFKRKEWPVVQRHPSGFRFPNGESFAEMQLRVTATIDELCDRHRGRIVVAVSHADPIKAALAHAAGTALDLFQRIVVSPCSVSAVVYGELGPTVLTQNSTADLTALQLS